MRSFADRIVFTASFCPAVSGPPLRWPCTCQPRIGALPRPWPTCIDAIVSRSSPTVRSRLSESSAPGMLTACRVPAFTSAATSRSASPIATAPGAWASTAAKRSLRENTASRSERCAIAHATASAAAGDGAVSVPAASPGAAPASLPGVPRPERSSATAAEPGNGTPPRSPGVRAASRSGTADGSADASRTGTADLASASLTGARASKPRSAACFAQTPRSSARSTSRLAARVISAARSARRGRSADAPRPRASIAASISARRVENAVTTSRGTPAISKRPSAWLFSIP